jgi:hypothetical protein
MVKRWNRTDWDALAEAGSETRAQIFGLPSSAGVRVVKAVTSG